ncbi:MAG: glutathione S-transferase domain-containing protein [Rhodospirillales bacterium]|nr:glutathione S-transferase domain-containing protein [Rhodospirillales bacterium]
MSPFGGRIRYLLYKYSLLDQADIVSPQQLGGMKSPEYMALHPAGKAPLLVLPSGQAIPESRVRSRIHACTGMNEKHHTCLRCSHG